VNEWISITISKDLSVVQASRFFVQCACENNILSTNEEFEVAFFLPWRSVRDGQGSIFRAWWINHACMQGSGVVGAIATLTACE